MPLRPTPVIMTDADGQPTGGSPSTVADGADIAEGSRADAPYTGGALGTLISILKGIWAACVAATPAGTNNIGIVAPQDGFQPGGTAGYTASTPGVLFTLDMTGYPVLSVQLLGAWVATVVFEVSNDGGSNWHGKVGTPTTAGGAAAGDVTATVSTGQTFEFAPAEKLFRCRVSAYTSGTIQAVPTLKTGSLSPRSVYVGGGGLNATLTAGSGSIGSIGATAANGGIASTSRLLSSAATTNATVVKASAGRSYKVYGYNTTASVKYLKLYNKASAPVIGTDTPVITRAIPPGSFSIDWADLGYYFSAGISYVLTGGAPDADATALAAGDILAFGVEYA